MDWLSRLFEMMPVRGRLDLRCSYGAPWRIDQGPGEVHEIPYHAVVGGSAVLEDPTGGRPLQLKVGDILLLPGNPRHVLHDGSGARPVPARNRPMLNLTISENAGTGDRLDLLCGHFIIAPPHDRLLRNYLPSRLVCARRRSQGRAGRLWNGYTTCRSCLFNARRVGSRSSRWPCDAKRAIHGDVRVGATLPAKQTRRRWDFLRSPPIPVWGPRSRRYLTSRRGHGRCRSLRDFATCRARRWPATSRRSLDDRPVIS